MISARNAYAACTRSALGSVDGGFTLPAAELAPGAFALAERPVRHALSLASRHPEGLLLAGPCDGRAAASSIYTINPTWSARMTAILVAMPDSVLWSLRGPEEADQRLQQARA